MADTSLHLLLLKSIMADLLQVCVEGVAVDIEGVHVDALSRDAMQKFWTVRFGDHCDEDDSDSDDQN